MDGEVARGDFAMITINMCIQYILHTRTIPTQQQTACPHIILHTVHDVWVHTRLSRTTSHSELATAARLTVTPVSVCRVRNIQATLRLLDGRHRADATVTLKAHDNPLLNN